jgi:midasin
VITLLNLERTYEKFVELTTGPIRSAIRSHNTGHVDDFAVEIISTTKMLSALAIPFDESADKKEKLRKSQLMRKRRAWSDLLKELKRVGFAANMKSDHLDHSRDVCWIREQPISTDLPRRSAPVVKSETYLCWLYALLPHLRASLADHHSDLTTRELQRGVGMALYITPV